MKTGEKPTEQQHTAVFTREVACHEIHIESKQYSNYIYEELGQPQAENPGNN